jgi:hypothetical protein
VAGKEASDAAAQEQAAQIANPRRPSAEVAAGISGVVENIDSFGSQRQAQNDAEFGMAQEVAQHLMATEAQCSFVWCDFVRRCVLSDAFGCSCAKLPSERSLMTLNAANV